MIDSSFELGNSDAFINQGSQKKLSEGLLRDLTIIWISNQQLNKRHINLFAILDRRKEWLLPVLRRFTVRSILFQRVNIH